MDVSCGATLGDACNAVLQCSNPREKVMAARKAARDWRLGRLVHRFDTPPPERPGRPDRPELLPPNRMPKRGKGGSERSRIAMIHALAHIEFVAIDLAFDLLARFGAGFPPDFADDWLRVGADEAMHFALLARRLEELGSAYGDLPAHDGLVGSRAGDGARRGRAARHRAHGAGSPCAGHHAGNHRAIQAFQRRADCADAHTNR
jgi:Uncharacterized protein conserved in bacteria